MKQTHTTKTTAIILTVMDGEYEVFEDLSIERYNLFDGQPSYPQIERNEDITQEDINKLFSLVREGVTDSTDPRVTETKIYKEFQRVERFSVVKRYRPKNREIDNNDNLSTQEIIDILYSVVDLVIDIILRSPYLKTVKIENLYECLYSGGDQEGGLLLDLSVFERLASSSSLILLRLKFDNSISFEKEKIQSFIEILSKSQSLQRLDLAIFNDDHYKKNSHFQQKLFFSKKEMLLFAESLTKFPNLQEVDLRESRFTPSRIKAMKDLITEKAPNLKVFF